MHRFAAVPLTVALLLPLAGCGGSDDQDAGGTANPTASQSASPTVPSGAPTPDPRPSSSAFAGTVTAPTDAGAAAFLAAAESICTTANTAAQTFEDGIQSNSDLPLALDGTLAAAGTEISDLRALAAGRPDQTLLDALLISPLKDRQFALATYRQSLPADLSDGAALPDPSLPEVNVAAVRSYGFSACAASLESE